MVVFIPIAMNDHIGMLYSNMVEFVEGLTYRAEMPERSGITTTAQARANPEKSTTYDHEQSSFPVSRLHDRL